MHTTKYYSHAHMYMHIHTCKHIHTHTWTHIHKYMHTQPVYTNMDVHIDTQNTSTCRLTPIHSIW